MSHQCTQDSKQRAVRTTSPVEWGPVAELQELIAARRAKLARIQARGDEPFPRSFAFTHRLGEAAVAYAAAGADKSATAIAVCGRVVAWRDHGKSAFAHLEDATGRFQAYFRRDVLGEERYAALADLDVGDFLGVRGPVFRTRTGELTVEASEAVLLAKCLRPPPEKWHGLKDVDTRFRRRAVDLLSNPDVRRIFMRRAAAVRAIRSFLDARGYLEVETPVLQPLYGGAEARPFTTRYESLDTTYFLRISNELYLKRLLVGGLDRVYEFSKDFRNEGLDRMHVPEFTLLELYEAYADYEGMMRLAEELFREVVVTATGGPVLTYQGRALDFSRPWPRVEFVPALAEALGFDPLEEPGGSDAGRSRLRQAALDRKIADAATLSRPKLLDKLFTVLVQDALDGPAFVVDHPIELSPLAKAHRRDARLVERFEPVIAGFEVGNAFSELNDPDEQRRRFEAQGRLRERGDEEAHVLDEDYLFALEHGMPPAGGLGIGLDRLVMLLCDATTIREVILFPQLRPDAGGETPAA